MKTYEHRQTGSATLIVGVLVTIWLIISAALFEAGLWVMVPVVAVVLAAFVSLRTRVDRKTVHVSFTYGWPRKAIAVKEIESHEMVRNKWFYGFGIRRVPGGWMFNVWGLDAVDVIYRSNGKTKTFRIGTNDPDGLSAAIATALDARPATG